MALNVGYIEATCEDVVVRIYYDNTVSPGPDQALIDGPRGYCLDITNLRDAPTILTVDGVVDQPIRVRVGQGDPVTTGPQAGRSRTAAQLAQAGIDRRWDVGNFQIEC